MTSGDRHRSACKTAADALANTGIEGLFANMGFIGIWDLRFAWEPWAKSWAKWVADIKSGPLE
jgi:hypothetical protein